MEFFKHINYSLGNEDWDVEKQALQVKAGDRVICVTASGDRSLHLLMTECNQIVSVDTNPTQTYLLELKLAAILNLDFEKYLAFLGCIDTPHRLNIFNHFKKQLSSPALKFWEQNKKMLAKGVLFQGNVERITHVGSFFFNLFRSKNIARLFSFDDIEEQRKFVNNTWDNKSFKKIFEWILNPNIIKFITKDPGLHAYVDQSITPGKYIYDRKIKYLNNFLAKKSALLQLVLTGKLTCDAYFPYLTYAGYEKIKQNTHRLTFYTDDIVEFIHKQPAASFNVFSLSDIASYMPQMTFERLLQGMLQASAPSSRFCLREFMSKRYIPQKFIKHFNREPELEAKLENEESNFVYRFFVGEVRK